MAERAAYDDDFYNWTQEQAALLRNLPRAVALPNAIDLAHIAKEIEDMDLGHYYCPPPRSCT